MSQQVDDRVVSMQFDNTNFEKNVSTSINSIDKLSSSIDGLASSAAKRGDMFSELTKAANNIDLSGVNAAVTSVKNGFTAMEIAGITVVSNLTNAFLNFGKRLWQISFGQIKSGGMTRALNIQQAEFMLKGMHQNVAQIKEDAMYAVEDTAYGFDEAAKAAAAFGTAGVKAGDDMKKALLGVSGVAAMTNRSYSEIADIYTKIAATGKLTSIYVDSFNVRGLNVLDALSKKLHVTQAQVKEMVSKGKIDFKTFAEAMEEAFGEHAKDADNTFQGAMSNVKAALSRIGADFATPIITDMIPVFHELKGTINDIRKLLGPTVEDFKVFMKIFETFSVNTLHILRQSALPNFIDGLRYGFIALAKVVITVNQAVKEVFPSTNGLSGVFRDIMLALIPSNAALAGFKEILKAVLIVARIALMVFGKLSEVITSVGLLFVGLVGNVIKTASSFKHIIDPVINFVNSIKLTKEQIKYLKQEFGGVISFFNAFKNSVQKLTINEKVLSFIQSFKTKIVELSEGLKKAASNINWTSVATIAFLLGMVFVIELVRQKLSLLWHGLVSVVGTILQAIRGFSNIFTSFGNMLKTFTSTLNKMQFAILAEVMLKFAISVGVLSLSLGYLAAIPSDDLMRAGIALTFIAGSLAALLMYMNTIMIAADKIQITAGIKIFAISAMFISMAVAMATMTAVVKIFSKMDTSSLVQGVLALYSIAAVLVLMSNMCRGFKTAGFISLSIATLLLSESIYRLRSMDSGTIAMATGAMVAMMTVVAMAVTISTLVPVSFKFLDFLAFGAMMVSITGCIKMLAGIPQRELRHAVNSLDDVIKLIKSVMIASILSFMVKPVGFFNLAIILGVMAGSLYLLKELDEKQLKQGLKAIKTMVNLIVYLKIAAGLGFMFNATGFISLTGILVVLTLVMSYLSKLDPDGMQQAMFAMIYMGGLIVAMAAIAAKIKSLKELNVKPIQKLAWALVPLAFAVKMLSKIEKEGQLKNSVLALVALGALVLGMAKLTNLLKIKDMDGLLFLELGASVILLAHAVNILSSSLNNGTSVDNMFMAIIGVGVLVAELMTIMKMFEGANNLGTITKGLVRFSAAVVVLTGAVAILSLLPVDKMLFATSALAVLTLALGYANKMINASLAESSGFAIMAASLLALSLVFTYMSQFDTLSILECALAISAMSLVLAAATNIAKNGKLQGAGAFLMVALGISTLAVAMSYLAQCYSNDVLSAIAGMILLTAAVTGLAALTGKFQFIAYGIAAISVGLLAIGITAVLIANSITSVSNSFIDFTNTMKIWGETSSEVVDRAIDNMNRFILGLESVANNITLVSPAISNAISVVGMDIAAVVGSITLSVAAYGGLGVLLFCRSILSHMPEILETLALGMDAMEVFFAENHDRIYEFGFEVGKVFFDGFIGGLTGIGAAIYDKLYGDTMKAEMDQAAADIASHVNATMVKNMDMYLAGSITADQMVAGLRKGLENGIYSVEDINRELAARGLEAYRDEIGINSPAKDYIESADFSVRGLIKGIYDGTYEFEDVMKALGEAGVDAFKSKFNSENLLGDVTSMLNFGAADNKDYLAIANTWDAEAEKYAWQLSGYQSAQEMANSLQSRAKEAEWNQMLEGLLAGFGLSMDDIIPKADEYGDYVDNAADALDNMTDASSEAAKQTDKLKESIEDALDVFTEFNEEATLTGRQVLQTFITQIRGVNTWQKEIQALGERGLNANFLQELADAGPDAYEKIHALYSMTEDELNLFNRMYAHKIILERGTAKTIRDSFVQNGAMTVEAAEKFGENIADGAANKVAESGEKIKKSEQKALDEAAEELEKKRIDEEFVAKWAETAESSEAAMTLANAFTKLGYESMDALQKSTNFEVIMDKLILFKNSLKEQLKGGLNLFEEVKTEEEKDKITATKLLDNMEENLKRVGGWSYNLRKMIKMGFSEGLVEELRQAGPESADKVEAFVKMTADEMAIANRYYAESTSLPDQLADRMVSAYADAGFTVSLGLKKGLEDGKDDLILQAEETGIGVAEGYVKGIDPDAANDVMKQLGSKSLSALKEELDSHSPSKKAEQIGIWFVEGFTLKEQMDWALRTIANTMGKFADAAIDTLSEKLSGNKTVQIARSFLQGFDVGIKKYSNVVGTSIGEVGNGIVKSFASALGVASPSVIAEEIMGYFLEGAMKPLTDDTTVAEAAKSQAMVIADMFKEGITEDMDGDVYSPTIRPVWDDSNIANGLIGLNNGLTGLSLSGTINTANSANRTGPSQDAVMITNAINNLYNEQRIIRGEINSLNSNMSSLGNRIDGMYVRLDGNALVGQIVSPMDKAMGKKVVTQKRGRV